MQAFLRARCGRWKRVVPAIREQPGPSRHTRIDVVGGAPSARPVWLELASREPGAGRQRIEPRARTADARARRGLRGCERLAKWLDGRTASFETAASRLPHIRMRGVLNAIKRSPHAEERRQAHLEARTIVVHQDACAEGQFFHSRSVGAGDRVLTPDNVRVGDEAVGDDLGMLDHIGRVPDDPWPIRGRRERYLS